ncbi:hypothetical protein ACWEX2_13940 [Staphylococcus xylosus]|uniref:Uncharacterized protein n=1 Tax=Staphylococcus xylosus TaxID=1288 RepID=A0AAQ0RVN8_STAXY|nr:hypothetical protein [Staphylococcus xylosus]RIM90419.1 hypothetical protein BU104_14465 [Staphylococcus xylosus]
MNEVLKKQIIDKAYNTANINKNIWNVSALNDIELHLLGFYEMNGILYEDSQCRFVENIEFETNKGKFLKELYEDNPPNFDELIDEFVECQTINELINTFLDGYGLVLENDVIIYFKEI